TLSPAALTAAIVVALEEETASTDIKLTRDSVQILWAAPTDANEAPSQEAAADDDASADLESTDASDDLADDDQDTEDDDAQRDADATEEATDEPSERLKAWRAEEAPTLRIACIRRVLDRDPTLQWSVRATSKGEEVTLRWRRPPRRH